MDHWKGAGGGKLRRISISDGLDGFFERSRVHVRAGAGAHAHGFDSSIQSIHPSKYDQRKEKEMIEEHKLSEGNGSGGKHVCTLPQPLQSQLRSFQPGHRRLRGPVPCHFEAFYRAHLRFVPGSRLRSSSVSRFYSAWAAAAAAPSLTFREVKRAMDAIGHRSINSNGVQYCDVGLATDHEGLADNFPIVPLPTEAVAAAIADRLDSMITELSSIRAEVLSARQSGGSRYGQ
jgi:hypothetical protein